MRRNFICIALMLFFLVQWSSVFAAAVPGEVSYQGRLLTSGGVPVATGNYSLTFRIFKQQVGGTAIWTEVHPTVAVQSDGSFSVILGSSGTPLTDEILTDRNDPAENGERWLEVQVGGDPSPLSPRTKLVASPFSLVSRSINGDVISDSNRFIVPGYGAPGDTSAAAEFVFRGDTLGLRMRINSATFPLSPLDYTDYAFLGIDTTLTTTYAFLGLQDGSASGAFDYSFFNKNGALLDGNGSLILYNIGRRKVRLGAIASSGAFLRLGDNSTNNGVDRLVLQGGTNATGPAMTLTNYFQQNTVQILGGGGVIGDPGNGGSISLSDLDGGIASLKMYFNADYRGDTSVILQNNAISSPEILDEPGVAQGIVTSLVTLTGTSVVSMATQTITCPSSGFVMVIGACQLNLNHVTGAISSANIGVSDVAGSFDSDQDKAWQTPSAIPTGVFVFSPSVQKVFPVTAGNHTFYLLGQKIVGTNDHTVQDITLSLMFFPTAYGTVTFSPASPTAALTPDVAGIDPSPNNRDIKELTVEMHNRMLDQKLATLRADIETRMKEFESILSQQQASKIP